MVGSFATDWVDSSGIRLWYTHQLRKYDAGVMELGLEYTDKMAIPPKQDSFTLTGYCLPQCTAVVKIFLSLKSDLFPSCWLLVW